LRPKFYKPIFFWDVKSAPNYIEKLILTGIATITLDETQNSVLHVLADWHSLRRRRDAQLDLTW
jgi:hypothetical protein